MLVVLHLTPVRVQLVTEIDVFLGGPVVKMKAYHLVDQSEMPGY